MQERTANNRQLRISPELQEYINELIKEVILNGKDFDSQKKWLKKYVEVENGDFNTLNENMEEFIKILPEYKTTKSDFVKQQVEKLSKQCHITDETLVKLHTHNIEPTLPKSYPYKKALWIIGLGVVGLFLIDVFIWQGGKDKQNPILEKRENIQEIAEQQVKEQEIKKNRIVKKCLSGLKDVHGDKYNYYGDTKNNLPNGKGIARYDNGDKYVGSYKNGKKDGQGTYTWVDGDKYVGSWKNDKMDGKGTCTWADGDKYVGFYKNGKIDGQGTYYIGNLGYIKNCPKCKKYKGNWSKGIKKGFGRCYDENQKLLYEGYFKDDKPVEETYPNR